MRQWLLTLCLMALCGCSDCPAPAVHDWTVAEQQQIAHERNSLPKGDILRGVLDDWERMRQGLK